MGQRSSPSVELLFNDCVVPVAGRLGEEGQGLKIALSALDGGRIGIAALAGGGGQGGRGWAGEFVGGRAAVGGRVVGVLAGRGVVLEIGFGSSERGGVGGT